MAIRQLPPKRGGRTNYATFNVINPGKGLNTLISDNLINDKEASDLENIEFIEGGAPAKASGFAAVGTGLVNLPRGLGSYVDTSNARYLLTVDGTGLCYLNGNTWSSINGATFASSGQINMTQAGGKMYIWDGTNGGAELSSLTLSRPGTIPSASFSIYYQGYHIAAGTTTQVNRLYIARQSDPSAFTNATSVITSTPDPDNSTDVPGATVFTNTTTPAANFIDVNKNDGDKITGLAKFGEALIIFKERAIYQLTFDSSGVPTISAVTKSYGCVSHRSIDNVDNDVFFLTRNGIYVLGNEPNFTNVIRTNELSSRVHTIMATINPRAYTAATGLFNQYVYYLGLPTANSTTNNITITYDRRYLAFSRWTHVIPESFSLFIDSNNVEGVYFTSATTNKIYKLTPGTYNADGAAITSSWTSKAFDLNDFALYKRWIDTSILFRQVNGVIDIEVIADGNTTVRSGSISALSSDGIGTFMFGEAMFGESHGMETNNSVTSATNNVPYRTRISKKSRTIKLRISNSRNNEAFVLLGFEFAYRKYSHFVFPSELKLT